MLVLVVWEMQYRVNNDMTQTRLKALISNVSILFMRIGKNVMDRRHRPAKHNGENSTHQHVSTMAVSIIESIFIP